MNLNFISPTTYKPLEYDPAAATYSTAKGQETYPLIDGKVVSFLPKQDDFYEGAYLNRVKFTPKSERWYHTWPLWLISNGYLWAVRRTFPKGSTLVELGCASGVDYFGQRYQMVGLDLSLTSLKGLHGYQYAVQADATQLPFEDAAVDGIISAYFWEHIPPAVKDKMLTEFKRVLKPGGKIVFLYDVETQNGFIRLLKDKDPQRYQTLFLDGDGHLGYESPEQNRTRFEAHGFEVKEHFGIERTWLQAQSVYEKYRHLKGVAGWIGKVGYWSSRSRISTLVHMAVVRCIDISIGRWWHLSKSRILLSVLQNT